ncbi:hypothetical protein ASPBRDRAFT_58541 [Aspergillus brasiliensis CBS 101740]|uniref:Uncharacterized protein n=1 Tax=Aspergillus brasiliensis (strain CBS 101740 / IMI 381727 / IBT 21946) TaxID=767769 RepID=A0A1L9U8E4_ASPBC|nr:hypothetical protein ASPBRDRAFT_58541 [Aspergillus brasiliensis CBS 101740]
MCCSKAEVPHKHNPWTGQVYLYLSERQSIRLQAQSVRVMNIDNDKWLMRDDRKFQIPLGTDALPGCIRTDSALAALMKASAFTVGCRYVGVYASLAPRRRTNQLESIYRGSTLRLTKPVLQDGGQISFVRTSWCKIYVGACAMDRGFIRQGGNTAFATLGIHFQPTSLDTKPADITKQKDPVIDPDESLVKFWGGASGRASECDGGETRGSRLIAQHSVDDALALSHSSALCDTGSCRSTVRRESFGSGCRHPLQTESQSPFRNHPPISFGQRRPGNHGRTHLGRGPPCQRRDYLVVVLFICRTNNILCPNLSAYYFSEFTELLQVTTSAFSAFLFLFLYLF